MTKDGINSIAVGVMSLAASVLIIFTPEVSPDSPWTTKLIVTLLGAISFSLIFAIVRWLMLRWHFRRLLGKWFYMTKPHEGIKFRNENFAAMTFSLGFDGELSYRVLLYPSISGLALRDSEKMRGRSDSLALNYDVSKECVELLFEVQFSRQQAEDQTRKGRLSLHFVDRTRLEGDYISEVWTGEGDAQRRISSLGTMVAARDVDRLCQLTGITKPCLAEAAK